MREEAIGDGGWLTIQYTNRMTLVDMRKRKDDRETLLMTYTYKYLKLFVYFLWNLSYGFITKYKFIISFRWKFKLKFNNQQIRMLQNIKLFLSNCPDPAASGISPRAAKTDECMRYREPPQLRNYVTIFMFRIVLVVS